MARPQTTQPRVYKSKDTHGWHYLFFFLRQFPRPHVPRGKETEGISVDSATLRESWALSASHSTTGWWLQTFFIFHNMWDNPSHWLIFFKMVKANRTMFPANLMGISCLVTLQEQLWLCSARQTTAITPIVTRLFPNIPMVMVYLPEISSLFTCINICIYI